MEYTLLTFMMFQTYDFSSSV